MDDFGPLQPPCISTRRPPGGLGFRPAIMAKKCAPKKAKPKKGKKPKKKSGY